MGYSYKGFFRYLTSSGRGGIGISVVAFKDGGTNFPWYLAKVLNDQDISGSLYNAVQMGSIYLILPDLLRVRGENENRGKYADLKHLAQYGEKYGGSLSMSFSVEKHRDGKFISMYTLSDEAAKVRSVDLINTSYVWYTALDLRLPKPILLSDGNRIAGGDRR